MADPKIITSVSSVQVPEGGQTTFNVRLSSRPRKRSVRSTYSGFPGIKHRDFIRAREMIFSRRNYNQWQTVTVVASEDTDHTNGQAAFRLSGEGVTAATIAATEVDNDSAVPTYQIVTDRNTMNVIEGGTAEFRVKLSADPGQSVSVTVGHDNGDTDLSVVSGLTYYFDSANWNGYQPVTVAAAEDSDDTGGQATFALSAAGTQTVYVDASEQDNDSGGNPARPRGHRSRQPDRRPPADRSGGRQRPRRQGMVHRHLVPGHRNHTERPRPP
jgi:hypothetical protein